MPNYHKDKTPKERSAMARAMAIKKNAGMTKKERIEHGRNMINARWKKQNDEWMNERRKNIRADRILDAIEKYVDSLEKKYDCTVEHNVVGIGFE